MIILMEGINAMIWKMILYGKKKPIQYQGDKEKRFSLQ